MDMATGSPATATAPPESHEEKSAGTDHGVCSFETQHKAPIRGLSVTKDGKMIIGDKKGWITVAIFRGE